ncbi:MAG: hypothetical protein V7K95_03465 [Nostoc sp.]
MGKKLPMPYALCPKGRSVFGFAREFSLLLQSKIDDSQKACV